MGWQSNVENGLCTYRKECMIKSSLFFTIHFSGFIMFALSFFSINILLKRGIKKLSPVEPIIKYRKKCGTTLVVGNMNLKGYIVAYIILHR